MEETVKKKKSIAALIIITVIAIIVIAFIVVMVVRNGSTEYKLKKQLDVADKYLAELDYDKAVVAYKNAISIDPRSDAAYEGMTDVYLAWAEGLYSENEVVQAVAKLEEAIEELQSLRTSENTDIIDIQLKRISMKLDEWKASDEDDDLLKASRLLENGDLDAALALYLKIMEHDPNNADAYLGIVEVYIRKGDFDRALEYAQKGYDITGDERLLEKINMIKSGNISDSRGNFLKTSTYDGNGNLQYWSEYLYDSNGNMIRETLFDPEGTEYDHADFKYDEHGLLIEGGEFGYIIDGKKYYEGIAYYQYDDKRRLIRIDRTNYKDGAHDTTENQYDGNNMEYTKSVRVYENADGDVWVYTTTNQFDGNGRVKRGDVFESFNGGDEKKVGCTTFTYDDRGNVTESDQYGYDENGNESLDIAYRYRYNEEGKMIKRFDYNGEGKLINEYSFE